MELLHRIALCVAVAGLGLALGGCAPPGSSAGDDEKEPHFVLGQSRVNARDFPGAAQAFEESLEANPHSAAAHFQLAMLYETDKMADPAAAIYHYQQYLRFDPTASNAEVITQRIYSCKQQLAADAMTLPSAPAVQQQLQQLADTNRFLTLQLDYYMRQLAAIKTNLPPAWATPGPVAPASAPAVQAVRTTPKPAVTSTRTRTHMVAPRETPYAIAHKCGTNVAALLAANPGLNPKKLRVGQILNIPSQ
jgi:LysM repeat protein